MVVGRRLYHSSLSCLEEGCRARGRERPLHGGIASDSRIWPLNPHPPRCIQPAGVQMADTHTAAAEQLSPEERSAVEELDVLVMEEERVVTAKWLCRHMAIPITSAKRIMKQYCLEKECKVQPVWQVSGWLTPSGKSGEGSVVKSLPEAVFQVSIVSSSRLAEVSKQYRDNPVPHVYSVQKILPVDPAILCVAEREQAKEIASRSDATNCVKDNRFSAVLFTPSTPPQGREAQVTAAQVPRREAPEPAKGSPSAKAETASTPAGVGAKGVAATRAGTTAVKGEGSTTPGLRKEEAKAGAKGGSGSSAAPKANASSASPAANGNGSAAAPSGNSLASLWKNKGSGTQTNVSAGKPAGGSVAAGLEVRVAGSQEREEKVGKEARGKKEEEEEEEWFDEEVVNEAAEFARLRTGEVGGSGSGAQKKPSKRMRYLHDEDEEDGEEEAAAKEHKDTGAAEGPGTLESAKAGESSSGAVLKSQLQGRGSDSANVASEAARDSEDSMEEGEPQGGEGEPGPGASDKAGQDSAKEPLAAANTSSAVNVKAESRSQLGQSGKRKKVVKTVIDSKGRETTIVEWETPGGDEAPAAAPGPASGASEPSGSYKWAGGAGAGKVPKSTSGSPTENAGASKAAPARAKPAKPAAAKPGQGSITSFFKKR